MNGSWLKQRIQSSCDEQNQLWSANINDIKIVSRTKEREIVDINNQKFIDFMSCSYLNLETHPRLIDAVQNHINQYGVQYAAARTRAKPIFFDELEENLNKIFKNSYNLTYNSVSMAHLSVLPLLASGELPRYPIKEKIIWFIDFKAHASMQILRGVLQQFGKIVRVDFLDKQKLIDVLDGNSNINTTPILLSDSIGSMGGLYDIPFLLDISKKI